MPKELIRLAGSQLEGVEMVEALGDFHHCQAIRARDDKGRGWILKSVESSYLRCIPDFDERLGVAVEIARQMQEYYELLSRAGLSVPHDHHVKVIAEPKSEISVIEVATDSGPDLVCLLTTAPDRAQEVIREVLETLRPIVFREDIGFDPAPANFAQNTRLTFIDFFPARYNGLVGFPQPEEETILQYSMSRYYTPFGRLRLLRFNLKRISSEFLEIFYGHLRSRYPEYPCLDLFEALLVEKVKRLLAQRRYLEVIDEIEGLGLLDIDDLREIAAELVPDRSTLNRLFELTQIDFRRSQTEREVRLAQFKAQLIDILSTSM